MLYKYQSQLLAEPKTVSLILYKKELNQLLIQLIRIMQEQRPTTKFVQIIKALPHNLIVQLLSFFDRETLASINQVIPNCKNHSETEKFFKMVRTYYFTTNFLNRTDRSLYYPFYDNPQFKEFQHIHLSNITEDNFPKFQQAYSHYRILFGTMNRIYPGQQQMLEQLQTSLVDPMLPMPKLRRENIGMFCKSSFQFFLTDIKYGIQTQTEEQFYGISQSLKSEFENNLDNLYNSLWQYANSNKENRRKIHEVRFAPEIINVNNINSFFIKNNKLHNLIVWVFAAAELLAEASEIYLSSIQDPIYRLVEFNLRYNIYKNFVLEIEEKLSFAFKFYGEIYEELFQAGAKKPKFTFWRSSMAKWVNRMNKLHPLLQDAYTYCLTKLRIKNICTSLSNSTQESPAQYISLLNKLQQNEFALLETEKLYTADQQNTVEQYFQQNTDLYQIAAVQYLEYIVDLSVNEHTVHYCGHSEHALQEPYLQFQEQVLAYNQRFYSYLQKIVEQSGHSIKILKQILQNQIEYLDICLVKPVTMIKMIKQAHKTIENISKQIIFQPSITYNFGQKDAILKHFNSKAQILESISAYPQKYLYSIWPLCPPQDKLMACSVETKSTDKGIEEYFSDQEMSEQMDIQQP